MQNSLREKFAHGVNWPTALWLGLVHVGCISLGILFFTWKALVLFFVLAWLTGGIGVCLGYHRYFTHRSFQTFRPVRWALALLGSLSGEGSPLLWVAWHRKHHHASDGPDDPHSPQHGFWWSHLLWLLPHRSREAHQHLLCRWASDLTREKFLRFLDRTFVGWHFALAGLLFAAGLLWDLHTAWSFVVWGVLVRMVWVWHRTWAVNSATHLWGYQSYPTGDNSRNSWWVALLSYGEGWHNNHHFKQWAANHGHRWWELDVTYWTIRLLEKLGLVWGVKVYLPTNTR